MQKLNLFWEWTQNPQNFSEPRIQIVTLGADWFVQRLRSLTVVRFPCCRTPLQESRRCEWIFILLTAEHFKLSGYNLVWDLFQKLLELRLPLSYVSSVGSFKLLDDSCSWPQIVSSSLLCLPISQDCGSCKTLDHRVCFLGRFVPDAKRTWCTLCATSSLSGLLKIITSNDRNHSARSCSQFSTCVYDSAPNSSFER